MSSFPHALNGSRAPRACRTVGAAFTLIETVVVLAVISALAAISLPSLSHAAFTAKRAACLANLSQFGVAFQMYSGDHEGLLPWAIYPANLREGVAAPFDSLAYYLDAPLPRVTSSGEMVSTRPYRCPADGAVAPRRGVSYIYLPLEDMLFSTARSGQRAISQLYERDPFAVLLKDRDCFHARVRPTVPGSGVSAVNVLTSGKSAQPGSERLHWSPVL